MPLSITTLYAVIGIVVVGVLLCLVGITIQLWLILRDVRAALLPEFVRVVQKTRDSLQEVELTLDDTHQIVQRANRATAMIETAWACVSRATLRGVVFLRRRKQTANERNR